MDLPTGYRHSCPPPPSLLPVDPKVSFLEVCRPVPGCRHANLSLSAEAWVLRSQTTLSASGAPQALLPAHLKPRGTAPRGGRSPENTKPFKSCRHDPARSAAACRASQRWKTEPQKPAAFPGSTLGRSSLGPVAKKLQYGLSDVKSGGGSHHDCHLKLPANEHGSRELQSASPVGELLKGAFGPQGLGPELARAPCPSGTPPLPHPRLTSLRHPVTCPMGTNANLGLLFLRPWQALGPDKNIDRACHPPPCPLLLSPLPRGPAKSPEGIQLCGG